MYDCAALWFKTLFCVSAGIGFLCGLVAMHRALEATRPSPSKRQCRASAVSESLGAYARSLAGDNGSDCHPPLAPVRALAADGVERLQARPARTEPLPGKLDCKLLPAFVAQSAASLPKEAWQAIALRVAMQPSGPITITVGTACSGSEFFLTACLTWQRGFRRGFGALFLHFHSIRSALVRIVFVCRHRRCSSQATNRAKGKWSAGWP